jgi:RNA polymerase sigma factor (sigma-70 family)
VVTVTARRDGPVLERLAGDLDGGYADFVRAHADAVYGAALRLTTSRADADDIAQETFVRAYRSLRRFDPERVRALQARPWLLAITLNLWRNSLRSAARRPVSGTGATSVDVPDAAPGPEDQAQESEDARFLAALLRALPEHHRVPVVLRHVAGLSPAEIATVLECPVGTAKANVARGLARLRDLATRSPSPFDPGCLPGPSARHPEEAP